MRLAENLTNAVLTARATIPDNDLAHGHALAKVDLDPLRAAVQAVAECRIVRNAIGRRVSLSG